MANKKPSFEDLFGAGSPFFGENSPSGDLFGKMKPPKPKIQNYTLRGDDICLEQIELEGKSTIKVCFPQNQVTNISNGTKGQAVRYFSPTDNAKRIVHVAYLNGRCRIKISGQ